MKKVAKLASMGVALGTLGAMAIMTPAYAEGYWTSSISGAPRGFESRIWTDNNRDSTNGYVRFRGCNANPDVGVYRADAGPDTEVKRGVIQCRNGDGYLYFGDVARGDYHFTIKATGTGAGGLNVTAVYVSF